MKAIQSTRPGGAVGYVGVPREVSLDGEKPFYSHVPSLGTPAPVRRFLRELNDLVFEGKIRPGKMVDIIPRDQVSEGYRNMDERRAIKAPLNP